MLNDDYDIKDKIDRLRLMDEYWRQAETGLREENDRFAENFRFYCGGDGQWDSKSIAILDEEGRPHFTINKCMSYVNIISGYQRKFRDTLTVFPRRGGNQNTARILTELGRHAMDSARPNGDLCLSEAFLMGLIGGKWWSGWREDYTFDPINGDIAPECVSFVDVHEDPLYRGYDLDENNPYNYCRFIFRSWFMEPKVVKILWPDKVDDVNWFSSKVGDGEFRNHILHGVTNQYSNDYSDELGGKDKLDDVVRYHVRRCYHKEWKTKYIIVNNQTGQRFNVDKDINKAKALVKGSQILELYFHTSPVMHQTTMLGKIELDHTEDPFNGITTYPLTRFCPFWVDGHAMGMIDNLKDPQKELNKSRNQILAHLNQSNNSGWIGEEDSFVDIENWQRSSTPGWVGEYKPGKQPPTKAVPAPISQGHVILAQMTEADFDKITNINDAVTGANGQKESGEALKTRRDQGLTTSEVVFDNFNQFQVSHFQNLTERIRTPNRMGKYLYSEEEVQQIVQEHNLPMDAGTLQDMQTGRYGMKVGVSKNTETARAENFEKLLSIIEKVPMMMQEVDPIDVWDASDISGKEKIMQSISNTRMQKLQQQMQMQQQQMQQQQMAMGAVG